MCVCHFFSATSFYVQSGRRRRWGRGEEGAQPCSAGCCCCCCFPPSRTDTERLNLAFCCWWGRESGPCNGLRRCNSAVWRTGPGLAGSASLAAHWLSAGRILFWSRDPWPPYWKIHQSTTNDGLRARQTGRAYFVWIVNYLLISFIFITQLWRGIGREQWRCGSVKMRWMLVNVWKRALHMITK